MLFAQTNFTTPGSNVYSVPTGTTQVRIDCWGAGGGGGSAGSVNMQCGGGGGGAYASGVVNVAGMSTISVYVGTGGGAGVNGENSYYGTSVVAAGGTGGTNGNTTAGAGGLATNCTGTTKYNGGSGAAGYTSFNRYSGGGGGAAGSSGAGSNASTYTGGSATSLNGGSGGNGSYNTNGNGSSGNQYGGGGGGSYRRTSGSYVGGSGYSGLVIVTPLNYVEVDATVGTALAYYYTLHDAFDAINAGTHKGVITVKILVSTTETTTASLNVSGGSSSYSSVTLYPNAAGLSVSGSIAGALIDLNGAQNVTIDGRVGGTGSSASLTINNTNTSAGATTVQFNNSAQNNTLKYCLVNGGGSSTTTGTVTYGTTGTNSGNTISNCGLSNNGTRRLYAIYSITGTNTGNTVSNNSIYNNWLASGSSYSIYLSTGSSTWTISGNSFFDSGIGTTGTGTYSAIYVNNTSAVGLTVSGNYIGGESAWCGGSSMSMGTSSAGSATFIPIYLNVGTGGTSSVQGNTIQNITYRSSNPALFTGISVVAGNVNVDGNYIGDASGMTSLSITETTTSSTSYGISLTSAGTINVTNNVLSSIVLTGSTTTFAHNFTGIYVGNVASTISVTGNVIGHATTAGSINISCTGTAAAQSLYGIYSIGTSGVSISNNTVANLTNASTNTATGTAGTVTGIFSSAGTNTVSGNSVHDLTIANANTSATTPAVCGLYLSSTVAGKTVSGNIVYNLSNTYTTATAIRVYGIYYGGATSGTNLVAKNLIHSLSASNTSALIYGLYINSGLTTYSNNIVNVGNTTSNCTVYGVYDVGTASNNTNFFFNTVYIGGTSTSSNSYALYSAAAGNTRDFRNNILYNARSRTSSGSNFTLYVVTAGSITANYNEYYVSGTGGVLGYYAANKTTLPIVTGQDANSLNTGPSIFQNAGGTSAADYKTQMQLAGVSGTGITVDYGNVTRSVNTIGAWEFMPVEIWNGSTYRGGYSTLKLAFDKINDGTWTGDLLCKIAGSTTETVSAVLNVSSTPSNYTSVSIYPTMTGLTVTGSINGPLISLNGADNVIIDGRVNATGSTVSLVINNTNASGSAVNLNNSASSNTIRYCTLQSSGTTGIIYFPSDSPSGATNYNNAFTNNILTASTARVASAIAIPANGTATYNGLNIQDNTIYNTWNAGATSYGISFMPTTASTDINITGNSFYETTDFQPSGAFAYYGVYVDNNTANDFNVSGNFFGGQAASCGGSALLLGNSAGAQSLTFIPVRLKVGTTIASSVQGNTIRNISFKSSSATPFTAIHIEGGVVNVGTVTGNVIGAITGTGSILLTGTGTSALSYGINVNSASAVAVSNNDIGSITATNAAANAHSFYGIAKTTAASGKLTIENNQIGSSATASSIQSNSVATGNNQFLIGIYSNLTDSVYIRGNEIGNLTNSTTRDNAGAYIYGAYMTGGNVNTVSGNFIYNLNCASAGTTNILAGLCFASGTISAYNNIINIGGGITTGLYEISGIKALTSALPEAFYHNTVYISGTLSGSTAIHSYAFNKAYANGSMTVKNNIFFNARTGGSGTGRHIAFSATNATGLTSDYNIYYAPNTNGVLCMLGSTAYSTLVTWKAATGVDDNTSNANPIFTLAGGTVAANYKAGLSLPGSTTTGVTTDFGGTNRVLWTAGAWEGAMNQLQVWNGDILRASYVTLKDAIDKINDGTWTGDLIIKINASTTETASVVLNASGTGSSNYSRLLIYPQSSGISITGNINGPLISLNGADNVAINGSVYLNNTSPGLTITNNNAGASASTIKFSESTQGNSIRYCILKGNPASATQGVVFFSTSSVGTGNSTDTIANNKISGTGATIATRPYNAVYSAGTSGRENAGIVLTGNEIFDFLNPGVASNGILIADYSNTFTISNNSFYETTAFTSSSAVTYNIITINNASGGGFAITGNYIGGNAASATGTWTKTGNNNLFNAILLNVGSAVRSGIQGNTIKGFNYTNTLNADWFGINVVAGGVDIGTVTGNSLGESAGTGSITLTNTTTSGNFYGIYVASTSVINCQNNSLGSINVGIANSTLSTNFFGIFKAAGAGNFTVSYNTVGGLTTVNSLYASSLATLNVQTVYGIYSAGTDLNVITYNTVANLANATTGTSLSFTRGIITISGSNTIDNNSVHHISSLNAQPNNYVNASLIGIEQISEQAGSTQNIRGNKVYSLKNITLSTIEMYGIFYIGPASGTHEISRNFVNTFIIISTDAAYLHGISLHTGTYTCSNNIVFLGDTITTGCHIWGIWNNSNSPINIFHNTVYLNGVATNGVSNSFAFRDISTAPTARDLRDNIFWNGRKNVSTISHYALYFSTTANTTLDYNDYQFAENFALVGSTAYASMTDWINATVFDDHSLLVDPELTNLGGISPSDYQPGVALNGTPITGIALDFGFLDRSLISPTMGAWEYVPNPVEIWNGATFRRDYATLKLAFDAINAATWTGDLTIKIKANIKETVKAVLYQSGYTGAGGTSNYTRIHIYPTRTDIQVQGNLATPLFELNGSDGVVFDGRVNGTGAPYNLTLQNELVSSSASTVMFVNSAESDTLKYCYIKGLTTNPTGGIVQFSTSASGNGNDNNCIFSNKITTVDSNPSTKSRVVNAIYSEGTATKENSGNCILDNEIYDVWDQTTSSNGINIGPNSTLFSISGNSVYETTTFTPSAANTYNGIRINNTSGNGFVLTGNYIGGKAVQCQGNALLIGTTTPANTFVVQPIYLNVGTSTATSVQGNIIRNFRLTSPNTAPFTALYLNAGLINVGTSVGNTIGNTSGTGSVNLIGVSTSSNSYGIYVNTTSAVVLANNSIGSVTTTSNATNNAHSFYAIYKPAVAGDVSVTGSTIGSLATSGSIRASSVSTGYAQSVYGVYSLGTGVTNIYNNTIANLLDSTTTSNALSNVAAIYFGGSSSASNSIQRNFIYGLSHNCTTNSALNIMAGIQLSSGSANVANNILWIGNAVTNNFKVYGIYEIGVAGQTNGIYHNTVYLSGTPSGTTQNSAAYLKSVNAGTTDLRDNIFYNARTGGTTGKHYAVYLPGTTSLTINANDYVCSGTLYNFLSADVTSLAAWKTATGQDLISLNSTPFTAPASALAVNFRPTLDLVGTGVGISYDYGMNPRNATTPTIGAWERVNKWKGSVSIDFNTAGNWTFSMVPAPYDNVIFDDAPNRPCTLDQDRFVTDIVNNQSTYRMIVNGYKLTIRGNLTFNNGAQVDASSPSSMLEFNGTAAQIIPAGALYTNKVYDLKVNNANNVTLNGTLILLNNLTVTSGKLNAGSTGVTINYGGASAQTIEANSFLNDKVYNLIINNPVGVTLNATLTADNDLLIQSGSSFTISENKGLTVTGTLTNLPGTGGLLLKSSATGTASLIQTAAGIPATVQRYIDGDTCAWHFMSSPISSQSISGSWIPSGTYGDGTGYDLYVWDEPASCWVYNLNTTVTPTWPSSHPQSYFVPGRGYLYAVQALTPTKQFVGNLNGGTITQNLTINATGVYQGFNLLGNPYPSSIDWTLSDGFNRGMLNLNGGGYDLWTWSTTSNNYGVYNSADADGIGTNNVTRYIAPMQAFFVRATSAGSFTFDNDARVHNGASVWLKSSKVTSDQNVHVSVSSTAGKDEVKFGFGYAVNESGAMKLFSPVETAPSLYMNCSGVGFSTRRLTDTSKNKYVPINFKAGETGTYTLDCKYDVSTLGTIFLQDRRTGSIVDMSAGDPYTFSATKMDAPERFVLYFGAVTPVDAKIHPNVWVSAGTLNVYLENMIGDYTLRITDLQGRTVEERKMSGSEQCSVRLFARGIYLATIYGPSNKQTVKVMY